MTATQDTTTTKFTLIDPSDLEELIALLYQYRDDMRHGVTSHGSRGRRIEAIEQVLKRLGCEV